MRNKILLIIILFFMLTGCTGGKSVKHLQQNTSVETEIKTDTDTVIERTITKTEYDDNGDITIITNITENEKQKKIKKSKSDIEIIKEYDEKKTKTDPAFYRYLFIFIGVLVAGGFVMWRFKRL